MSATYDPGLVVPSGRTLCDPPTPPQPGVDVPTGADAWHRFAWSYRAAADELSERAPLRPRSSALFGPPMLFLYRQAVELQLKALLADAGELLDDPQLVPPRHELPRLWRRVRTLLLQIDPASDGPWFARADVIVGELDAMDPGSFAFRYPVDTTGVASLPAPLVVDPGNVRRVCDELFLLLDGAASQVHEYAGYKREMR